MCTRFVYNGIDKIVGFNFDIDLFEKMLQKNLTFSRWEITANE